MTFLIPSAKGALLTSAIAAIVATDFKGTVSVGSIIVAAAVIVAGGLFTLRNNMKTFWRNLAEERGEQIKVMAEHAEEKLKERADFAEQQRELRHELKNDLASARGQLEAERLKLEAEQAKHDLTALYTRFDALEHTVNNRAHLFEELIDESKNLVEETKKQGDVLGHILQALKAQAR